MKKLIMIVLAAVTTGSAYAAPHRQQPRSDTTKTKKVKPRDPKSNIRISGDTTEYKIVKDSIKR